MWAWLINTTAQVFFTAVCYPSVARTASPSPSMTLSWQSLSSTTAASFTVENGKCFPHQVGHWTSGWNAPAMPGVQGASAKAPWAKEKKCEIKQQHILFAFMLPGVAVVELLNQSTPNHVSETCAYIPLSVATHCLHSLKNTLQTTRLRPSEQVLHHCDRCLPSPLPYRATKYH